jgi:hypothetical protein
MDLRIEVCEPISATLSSNPPICPTFANTTDFELAVRWHILRLVCVGGGRDGRSVSSRTPSQRLIQSSSPCVTNTTQTTVGLYQQGEDRPLPTCVVKGYRALRYSLAPD